MESFAPILLFVLFALVLLIGYVVMRRKILRAGYAVAYMLVGSIAIMFLISLASGNNIIQAAFVGIIVGGIFSIITAAIGWYFLRAEERKLIADQPANTNIE